MTTTADDPANPGEFVSRLDAALMLGISVRQLDRLCSDGKLTKYRREVGRERTYFLRTDLEGLLALAAETD